MDETELRGELRSISQALGQVTDQAWNAAADVYAVRLLLGTLLAELQRSAGLDAPAFVRRVIEGAAFIQQPRDRIGLDRLLPDLLAWLEGLPRAPGTSGTVPPGTVFH